MSSLETLMSELRAAAAILQDDGENLARYREQVAQALQRRFACSMASLWRMEGQDAGHRSLRCVAAFSENPALSADGIELREEDFGVYLTTLLRTGVYHASQAQEDPNLAGLKDGYLVPQGVTALLDVAFRINGRLCGVLCIEQRGTARAWSKKDESDLRAAAGLIGLAIARVRPDLNAWR